MRRLRIFWLKLQWHMAYERAEELWILHRAHWEAHRYEEATRLLALYRKARAKAGLLHMKALQLEQGKQ